ncbi:MAG: glycosyltransferase family 39 protein, partial [Candidatus Dormibacteria bacterium]
MRCIRRSGCEGRLGRPAGLNGLPAYITAGLVLGVFFRLYHADHKVYWEDEVYTSLHVLGFTEAEVVKRAPQLVDATALRTVLHPTDSRARTIADTIHSLAAEDPQHPPLYYVIGHLWVRTFGDSTMAIRLLSVAIGLMALPCMYWLGVELFGSSVAAWLGVALLAISPIGVLYSQEAREYVLWSLAVIVLGAVFLRAMRVMSVGAWGLYAVALALSLYVYPLSGALALGQMVVLYATKPRGDRVPVVAPLAFIVGIIAFVPWLAVIAAKFHTIDRAVGLTS